MDSGFVKTRLIQPSTGIEMLKVTPVSKAQANQRAGRAGRESEGKCYRLFTEGVFEALELVATPEIQRVNVAQVVLQLKQMGVASPMDFPYVSPPSPVVLRKALELLFLLGALGKVCRRVAAAFSLSSFLVSLSSFLFSRFSFLFPRLSCEICRVTCRCVDHTFGRRLLRTRR